MKIRPSIAIVEEGKILLMRYEYNGESLYNLPGGNAEEMETLADILARELEEELQIEVKVGNFILTGETIQEENKKTTLHVVFEGKITKGAPVLNPKETSALEICWLPLAQISEINMYPHVGAELRKHFLNKNLGNAYLGRIKQRWL